jgi:hypothetical protein
LKIFVGLVFLGLHFNTKEKLGHLEFLSVNHLSKKKASVVCMASSSQIGLFLFSQAD